MESLALIVSLMLLSAILFPLAALALYLYNSRTKSYIGLGFQILFSILGLVACGNWAYVALFPMKLIGSVGIGMIIAINFMTIMKLDKD